MNSNNKNYFRMTGGTEGQVKSVSMGPPPYLFRWRGSVLVKVWGVEYYNGGKKPVGPQTVVFLDTVGVRKANPCPEQMSIPLKTKH